MSENNYQITIKGSFQRSRRLDTDELDAGYVLLGTGRQALEIMAGNILGSAQSAFTWTGPYGCGKSSLALFLASLVGTPRERDRALTLVGVDPVISRGFSAEKGWKVIGLVGRQGSLAEDLGRAVKSHRTNKAIANALERMAEDVGYRDGVLVMIDELGKYLEADCASENTYLLQELAELASRSKHRIVLVGILHQAFDAYASRLPTMVRDEWTKVQGRFIDIPLAATTDETLELLSRAIVQPVGCMTDAVSYGMCLHNILSESQRQLAVESSPDEAFTRAVETACRWMEKNAGNDANHLKKMLAGCWPLNPVTALMLGPVSRRRFSQNERSIYSFLSARESAGFTEFIESETPPAQYTLARFWDYLQANFETAIMATTDAHRWLTAVDAVNRAETRQTPELIALAKTVAVIDLFHIGSRLQASAEILSAALCWPQENVLRGLDALVKDRVLIERKHAGAWAVFAGSDFDMEAAMREAASKTAGIDVASISDLINLDPLVSRAHYLETGTMRWFNRRIASPESIKQLSFEKVEDDAAGELILVICDKSKDEDSAAATEEELHKLWESASLSDVEKRRNRILVLGMPSNAARIVALAQELQAVNLVARDPILEGDATGRNEVNIRRTTVRRMLTDELTRAFLSATWLANGRVRTMTNQSALSDYLSDLCAERFSAAPRIVNELVNRDYLSGNIVKARKQLLASMLAHASEPRLGFEGYPPAYGLYVSILKSLHKCLEKRPEGEVWGILSAPRKDRTALSELWRLTDEYVGKQDQVSAAEIYRVWRRPPFGMKWGPMPILFLAYLLGNRDRLAVYDAGVFLSEIAQSLVDDLLANPADISVRRVERSEGAESLLAAYANVLKQYVPAVTADALSIGRAVVSLVLKAPAWAQRTQSLAEQTLKMRRAAQKAHDPIDFVLREIPEIFKAEKPEDSGALLAKSLHEYLNAAPELYAELKKHLFFALQADPNDYLALNERAKAIKGLSGNMSQEAFVNRMSTFKGTDVDIVGLWNLAAGKPINMCSDLTVKECLSRIDQFAYHFRQQETFAALRGRNSLRRVISVALSSGGRDVTRTIELSVEKAALVHERAVSLMNSFKGMDKDTIAAILAEAGVLACGVVDKARKDEEAKKEDK